LHDYCKLAARIIKINKRTELSFESHFCTKLKKPLSLYSNNSFNAGLVLNLPLVCMIIANLPLVCMIIANLPLEIEKSTKE
jgi:hypothetical protein